MTRPVLLKQPEPKKTPIIIDILKKLNSEKKPEIDAWFAQKSLKSPPFFYNSVDLRHSGFKLAPVDTNLFPAGFNNLNEREREVAVTHAKELFASYDSEIKKILILAEDHTRNKYYLDNISVLKTIIEKAGVNVAITNLAVCASGEAVVLEGNDGNKLDFVPAKKNGNKVEAAGGFVPEMIIVNNDLTGGAPALLQDVKQIVSPPVGFGWYQRRKTSHFDAYNNMAREFCKEFDIDPWLLSTYFEHCGIVNFKEKTGIECVALKVEKAISRIQAKYEEYGIKDKPYVFVKSDKGTYGMGIMTASSGDEIYEMGKKIRNKMNTIKGGVQNSEVIIQEGIATIDRVEENPAEPMIYVVGGQPTGCIYRYNTKKDSHGNLNASGMAFTSIEHHSSDSQMCCAYGLVSKLASYAAAWECYVEVYSI